MPQPSLRRFAFRPLRSLCLVAELGKVTVAEDDQAKPQLCKHGYAHVEGTGQDVPRGMKELASTLMILLSVTVGRLQQLEDS